jgi:drug/metabolite transporter (DMT)-like permease
MIVQPVGAPVGWPSGAALLSALCLALAVAGIKVLAREHGPATLLIWSALLGMLLVTPMAIGIWRLPESADLVPMFMLGVASVGAQAAYVRGMAEGDAAAMAAIDYSRLVFASAVGYLLFHEIPGLTTVVGACMIICATIGLTFWDYRRDRNRRFAELMA